MGVSYYRFYMLEAQDSTNAKTQLSNINIKGLNTDQLVQVAYAYRLINLPVEALATIEQAYQQNSKSSAVLQEYVYDLAAIGAYKKAQQLLQVNEKISKLSSYSKLYKSVSFLSMSIMQLPAINT